MPYGKINNKIFILVPHSLSGQTPASRQTSLVDTSGNPQYLLQYHAPVLKENTVLVNIYIYITTYAQKLYKIISYTQT